MLPHVVHPCKETAEPRLRAQRIRLHIGAALLATAFATCGGHGSPTQPTNDVGSGGGSACTPATNAPPIIASIGVQGTKPNEPADFAEVGESIPITAVVLDAETPIDRLQLQWTANVGRFSGSGASVTWEAPPKGSVVTPMDVTVTLNVRENYGCPDVPSAFQNNVAATHTISLHDSNS